MGFADHALHIDLQIGNIALQRNFWKLGLAYGKQMESNMKIRGIISVTIAGLVCLSGHVHGKQNHKEPEGWSIDTNGGFKVKRHGTPYWFKLGGSMQFDQLQFLGNKTSRGKELYSGASLRELSINMEGGIAKNISYSIVFDYEAQSSKVNVEGAYFTYTFPDVNMEVSVGRVDPAFSLENASSRKWIPLIERSMPSSAFGSAPGMGVSFARWEDEYSILFALSQPKPDNVVKRVNTGDTPVARSDRWSLSGRLARNVYQRSGYTVQLGVSGYVQDDSKAAIRLKAKPEVTGRNVKEIVDTGNFTARNHKATSFEAAVQNGPLYAEAEYKFAWVKRARDKVYPQAANANRFNGYHMQVAYVLTGESRTYNAKLGTFGKVKPASKDRGAWEICGRYSFINLNSVDINGGSGHNMGLGVNWYLNENLSVYGQGMLSRLNPSKVASVDLDNRMRRHIKSVALRLQAVF
jgi:phosphate-selective porin OprO/OprP